MELALSLHAYRCAYAHVRRYSRRFGGDEAALRVLALAAEEAAKQTGVHMCMHAMCINACADILGNRPGIDICVSTCPYSCVHTCPHARLRAVCRASTHRLSVGNVGPSSHRCTCLCTCRCTCLCACLRTCRCRCRCTCLRTCRCTCPHTCPHTFPFTWLHVCVCACMSIDIPARMPTGAAVSIDFSVCRGARLGS